MKTRKIVIGALVVVIGLPVVLVLIVVAAYYMSFYVGLGVPQTVSERLDMDGELGSKKPVRTEPHRICGGGGCHPPRVHELC